MSLLDLVTPSKKVVINQAFSDKSEVVVEVFGLTTEDLIYLAEKHPFVIGELFVRNSKGEPPAVSDLKFIWKEGANVIADIIGCGCKDRNAAEWLKTKPPVVQAELLVEIFALTFPEGLKKSLEKLAPMIGLLLRK
nr:hypothetical protein [Pseudomonas sp. s4]